jgi:hypothetical protein
MNPATPSLSFDSVSRRITSLHGPEAWVICFHLGPLLQRLLEARSEISFVTTAWTRTALAVSIAPGPTPAELSALGVLPESVSRWTNDDSHYSLESGLLCSTCRHAISWPARM